MGTTQIHRHKWDTRIVEHPRSDWRTPTARRTCRECGELQVKLLGKWVREFSGAYDEHGALTFEGARAIVERP